MSLFGSLMADMEDDPFFGQHLRQMRHMQNMMNSLLDPFGMGGPFATTGMRHGSTSTPFMPQMPPLNRLFTDLSDVRNMGPGSSYSSSTFLMSNGPNGKPEVYSATSSTKIGSNGLKETRKTMQDSRTGTKKMSIGHHIGERAHVIEREHNVYSGDAEQRQEFINLEEDDADDFDREFEQMSHMPTARPSGQLLAAPRLALCAAPATVTATEPNANVGINGGNYRCRPQTRRPLRATASPLATASSANVREVYAGAHPQRTRHKHAKQRRHASPASTARPPAADH